MSADLFSNFIGMTLQAIGNNNNAWGSILNGSALVPLERAIAGNIVRTVTGGTLDLSGSPPPAAVTQVLDFLQIFQGVLTANQIVIVPNLSRSWKFDNQTTGAFQLLLQTPSGAFINIPQGTIKGVVCDGNGNLIRHDADQVGSFRLSGKPTAGAGELVCNGASLLISAYPDLYSAIGKTWGSVDSSHFTLPLLTDTNRYLRAADGTNITVGTYQANQNLAHTHAGATFSATTGNESAGHTHTGSGSTGTESAAHTHTYNGAGGSSPVQAGSGITVSNPINTLSTGSESTAHSHAYSFTTATESANHTHSVSGTTGTIPASGGSEARPESAAVLITIVY
jgi:microcystin-dependent protein